MKKSKHLSFQLLLDFHDTIFEKIKARHRAHRDRELDSNRVSPLPAYWHPRLTAKKKRSTETPTTQNLCMAATWQSPRLVQGSESGWACQEMYHFHMQRQHLPLLYIPSSFPSQGKSSHSQAALAAPKQEASNSLPRWLQLHLPLALSCVSNEETASLNIPGLKQLHKYKVGWYTLQRGGVSQHYIYTCKTEVNWH